MPWVKSEYAGELAVLSAWVATFLPWSITFRARVEGGRMTMIRFPLGELQIRSPTQITLPDQVVTAADVLDAVYPGWQVYGSAFVADPVSAALTYGDGALQVGSAAWALGAVCVLAAFVLSVAMYRDEEAVARRLPRDEVRVMGALLGVATLAFAAATVLYYQGRAVVGHPIPVGVVLVGALAVALLRVERL